MKNLFKFLIGLFAAISFIFAGCSSDSGSSGGASGSIPETADETPGTISEIDPMVLVAAEVATELDSAENSYIVVVNVAEKTDYSDLTSYCWVADGKTSTEKLKTVTKDGYSFGYMVIYDGTTLAAGIPADVGTALDAKEDIKIIIKNLGDSWSWQTPDLDMPTSTGKKHFFISSGKDSKSDASLVAVSANMNPSITFASAITTTNIKVYLSVKLALEMKAASNGFSIVNSEGVVTEVSDVRNYEYKDTNKRGHNFTNCVSLIPATPLDLNDTYFIKREGFEPIETGFKVNLAQAKDNAAKETQYDGNDLGLTLNGSTASFKTWAPVASDVKLLLFASSAELEEEDEVVDMTFDETNGTWAVAGVNVSGYKYYKFRITNFGETNDVCDIYAKAASADSVAAQITDINSDSAAIPGGNTKDTAYGSKSSYYNPFGNSGSETKKYTDAVIYEMHIRDWSRLEVADSTGKFLDIANGTKVIEHIKNLGITHVQFVPVFDYAQKNDDPDYNWGYNPYHYNVPEGRYVTEGYTDGTQAVKEFRELIARLHEAGIAVIMDVVYNHTSGTGKGSLYDMTVPYYYYRTNEDGTYSNGSGCGNETDSGAPMFRKYIIDSMKHWMLDYHVNGFRFDLMGLHEVETMKEIYKAVSEIDPNVMVYGEPWNGGTSPVVNPVKKPLINDCADTTYSTNGVACFNDTFRNAIKGSEYPDFGLGEVSDPTKTNTIVKGMKNQSFTNELGRSINYVECHDNLTLADKLGMCVLGNTKATKGDIIGKLKIAGKLDTMKNLNKICATMIFTTPGTVFINGGQEFLRSKQGDENSYASSDEINEIKESFITEFSDVTDYYKGLIKLRKTYPDAFCYNTNVDCVKVADGVIKFESGDFIIFYNNTKSKFAFTGSKYEKYVTSAKLVTIDSGDIVIADSAKTVSSLEANSVIILKK